MSFGIYTISFEYCIIIYIEKIVKNNIFNLNGVVYYALMALLYYPKCNYSHANKVHLAKHALFHIQKCNKSYL